MSSLSALIAVRATVTSNHQLEKLIIWDQSQFWAQIIEIESGFTHPWIKSPHTTRTTGQDRGHLKKFLARMKMLNKAGKTIILISHDMGVVAEYASRTIVMNDGGIFMDAGTREMFSRPDILEEASIEPHLLARACNDVRKGGRDVPVMLTLEELERYVG